MEHPPECRPSGRERAKPRAADHPGMAPAGESCERFLALLHEFYKDLAEPPPIDAEFVSAQSLPQPQRGLLVHASDMTSTLAGHYGEPIALRMLDRHEGPQWYRRHIVLETSHSRRPVEYGAMRVLLPLLNEAARADVLAAKTPLGAVLAQHALDFRHCPSGYFRVRANRLMVEVFGLSSPQRLFGRCNCMSDRVGRVVAEVIEILPP
jgi:hypothetical protein